MWSWLEDAYDSVMGLRPLAHLDPYFEGGDNGRVYHEVVAALSGNTDSAVRVNQDGKLVLSVAVPIKRLATLYGALMLTTESGDIDGILKEERLALIEVFLVALCVVVFTSIVISPSSLPSRCASLPPPPSACAAAATAASRYRRWKAAATKSANSPKAFRR